MGVDLENLRLGVAPLQSPILQQNAHPLAAGPHTEFVAVAWAGWFNQAQSRLAALPAHQDTHANRVSTTQNNYAPAKFPGILFWETDRKVFYLSALVANVWTWVYAGGECASTQAALPADLGTNDAGFLCQVTDYGHKLKWSGSAWGWAPGDAGSGYMQLFEVDPSPATGWHLYDGSAVTYLKSDGTTASVTLPDLTSVTGNAAYTKAGSPASGPNAAVAPSLAGGSVGSATTGITLPANTGNDSGAGQVVASGAGVTVASHPHTHTEGSVTDPGHTHTVSGLTAGSNGEPRNLVRRPWFRL